MSGYAHEYGMSNRAVDAYQRGIKPLSRITIDDLKQAGWKESKKLAIALAKCDPAYWPRAEWHHSGGTWYNEVDFYDPEELVCIWYEDMDKSEREEAVKIALQRGSFSDDKCKPIRVKGTYAEFGGSRRRPRYLGDVAFTGVRKGNWIHLDGGGKKKATGNHIKFEYVD